MAETTNRGPSINLGSMIGSPNSPDPYDGPGMDYQGTGILDVRYAPANKDGMSPGRFPGFFKMPYVPVVDQIPSTAAATTVANTQAGTTTVLALNTVCVGGGTVSTTQSFQCAAVVPIVPYVAGSGFPNQGAPVNVLALDFGFTVGTVAAGNTAVTAIPDVTQFSIGQWIVIGGAGNSAKTLPLVTQIQTITVTAPGTSTQAGSITVLPVPAAALTAAPIGSANSAGVYPAQATATAANPYVVGGVSAFQNPIESLTRGLSYTAAAAATATSITVKGYDLYGVPMTETATLTAGAVVYGKKAFKYILSATLNAADAAHNYSVGTSDVFGINLRSDKWEYTDTQFAAAAITATAGWLAGAQQTATATTGDVRGTFQMGTVGGGTASGSNSSNNARRYTQFLRTPLFNAVYATSVNPVPLFGVTQF